MAKLWTEQDYENRSDALVRMRDRRGDQYMKNLDERMDRADRLIGEMISEGKTVFYINVLSASGRPNGKIKTATNRFDLINYLLSNKYV